MTVNATLGPGPLIIAEDRRVLDLFWCGLPVWSVSRRGSLLMQKDADASAAEVPFSDTPADVTFVEI
ncbi:hypothetical protein XENOCAPTIV_019919 [Xenoophorus captivus]|uniref:Uncharacterized protein n=1 Tax=Xenoophorus captivus TaxID=1517983 RepID=A0ABV0QKH2_9TELE